MSVPSAVAMTVARRPTSSDVTMASWIPSTEFQFDPVVERELLPDVVEAARRGVEGEEDHDSDREHQVADDEKRVDRQRMVLRERPDALSHARVATEVGVTATVAHPVSRSEPTIRAYTRSAIRISPIRMNESDAAPG